MHYEHRFCISSGDLTGPWWCNPHERSWDVGLHVCGPLEANKDNNQSDTTEWFQTIYGLYRLCKEHEQQSYFSEAECDHSNWL